MNTLTEWAGGEAPAARLQHYLDLLSKWNAHYNLTAVRDRDEMLTHHLLDSLAMLPLIQAEDLLDVGSGAGLPGIPLAVVRPQMRVTLLDSNHKKAAFLRQAVIELKLDNVTVVCARVEDFAAPAGFDAIISRAFSDLAQFTRSSRHLLRPDGQWLAMKGLYPHEELDQLPAGVRVVVVESLCVPGLDAARHAVLLKPE